MKQLTTNLHFVWAVFCGALFVAGCTHSLNRSYDAVSLLGFGEASNNSLPEASADEIVIRYGGWSYQQLLESTIGKKYVYQQSFEEINPTTAASIQKNISPVSIACV